MSTTLSPAELESVLDGFTGTDGYHRHSANLIMTDGAKYLAEKAGCFWLFDIFSSVQTRELREKADGYQFWEILVLSDDSALVRCHDGGKDGGVSVDLYKQQIEYTDFPLGRDAKPFLLIVAPYHVDEKQSVVMLTSER